MATLSTEYTWEEIAKHDNASSLWIVFDGKVYDVTKFVEEHPGGEDKLLNNAATDATSKFEEIGHSPEARELRQKFQIGVVAKEKRACGGMPSMGCWLGAAAVVALGVGIIIAYKLYKK